MRMRVRYWPDHHPPVWVAEYAEGRIACYCHAATLDEMWEKLRDGYAHEPYLQKRPVSPAKEGSP